MKRAARRVGACAAALGVAAVLGWTFSGCATTEEGTLASEQPSVSVPEAGAAEVSAPVEVVDGGCDASEDDCVTEAIGCDQAAFCPVPTNVKSLYALTAVWGSSKNDVWAAGSGGTVLHWDGTAWKQTTLPPDAAGPIKNTFHAIGGSGPNDVWVASATNVIFHSDGFANGDAGWTRAPSATEEFSSAPIYTVWATASGELRFGGRSWWVFGEDIQTFNQIQKDDGDAGVAWLTRSGAATVHGLWGASANELWLVGDNSMNVPWQLGLTMRGTRAPGEDFTWTEVDSQSAVVLRAIWGASAGDVWAVGDKGTVRHIGAGAAQWSIVASPTTETLHSVWGASADDVWAVGESGTILHWDGVTWKESVAAFPVNKHKPHLYAVWGSGPDDVWVVGDGIALHHTGGTK